MKILNGTELAGFIKQRQAKQVRSIRQTHNIVPKLAIVKTLDDPVIDTYVRLKRQYGEEVGVEVDAYSVNQDEVLDLINKLNINDSVHGIIIQLPLADPSMMEEILNAVVPDKDVDGLGEKSNFTPATPKAIMWLIDGYNYSLLGKKIAVVGRGRLVGAPLERELAALGNNVISYDKGVADLKSELRSAQVVISATGQAGLITADMLAEGTLAIDAGVATEGYKTVGDFADDVYERDDLSVTPKKGGVGPLTVCALFENLIASLIAEIS